MKKGIVLISLLIISGCSSKLDYEQRVDAAVKLCQSETTKAFSKTSDGLRIMCPDGSSYIIRDKTSVDDLVELDEVYCSSMGIRDFTSDKDGKISLKCKDGANFTL